MGLGTLEGREVRVWSQETVCPWSQGVLTCEGGSGGWTHALGDQHLVVLLTRQGAVHDLVLLDLCFAVVPLQIKAGRRVGANPQVLGGVNL